MADSDKGSARPTGRAIAGLSERLKWCFANRLDPDGEQWTDEAVAVWVTKHQGVPLSYSFVRALRTGQKTNASWPVLSAMSEAFGVPLQFWSSSVVAEAIMGGAEMDADLAAELSRLARSNPAELAAALELASRLLGQLPPNV